MNAISPATKTRTPRTANKPRTQRDMASSKIELPLPATAVRRRLFPFGTLDGRRSPVKVTDSMPSGYASFPQWDAVFFTCIRVEGCYINKYTSSHLFAFALEARTMLTDYMVTCPNPRCHWSGSLLPYQNRDAWKSALPATEVISFRCPKC